MPTSPPPPRTSIPPILPVLRVLPILTATLLAAGLAVAVTVRADDPPAAPGKDADAFRAAREALADRDFKTAVTRLQAFTREFAASPYAEDAEVLLGRARQLAGDPEGALSSLTDFVRRRPESPFAAKARLVMAESYVALKRFADAADVYRARLEFLRGDGYRDRIGGYYLEVADPAYDGRPVQDPATLLPRTVLQHDWAAALEYYRKALAVMGRGKLRAERGDEIRRRIGHALLELDRAPEAVMELAALVAERGKELPPAVLGEALFDLGSAYRKAGQAEQALQAFTRIEAELGDHPRAPEALAAIGEIEVERAFAAPGEPERKAALSRGIAAFDRFLKQHPQSPLAPAVSFSAGEALARAGDHPGAIARFRELIARYGRDERAPTAQLRIADLLKEDHAYDAAVAEWKKFLSAYANDPQWSEAQAKIDEALYEEGLWLLREKKKPEEARAAWALFLAERPLSPFAPEVYRRFYELALEKKDYPRAANALRMVVEKYPTSPLAPSSALLLARLLGGPMADLEGAIREYEALVAKFPQSGEAREAAAALEELRAKRLVLLSPRAFHTGEPWTLRVEARNIPKLRFKAYRVNLEEYFRKRLAIEGIEEVAVGLVEPAKAWEVEVGADEPGGYKPYKLFAGEKKLPLPEDEMGGYIVTAEEESLQAVVLTLRSDLALVEKASPRQTFLWAFDARTGEPLKDVKVILADGSGVFQEGATGPDGTLVVEHAAARPDVRVLARMPGAAKGVHYATGKTAAPAEVAYGYTTKVHVTTDRPLYRPGQTVRFRAILRKVEDGRYGSSEGEPANVLVTNPLGVVLYQETLKANEFGAISGSVELTDEPPLGEYTVQVAYRGGTFPGKFKVEEYRKPEFSVSLKTERSTYLRGEEVKGKVTAEYLFGGPVPRAKVEWKVFAGPYAFDASRFDENRWFFSPKDKKERAVGAFKLIAEGSGETNAQGEMPMAFHPLQDGADHTYRVQIEATDLSRITVAGSDDVLVTGQEIYVVARVAKKAVRAGDRVTVSFRTVDAASRPVDAKGEAVLEKRTRGEGPEGWFWAEVERQALVTTGGKAEATFLPKEPGEYRAMLRTRDRAGNPCEGGAAVRVAGDEPDLAKEARLLFEKAVYHQGEEARLFVSSPVTGRKGLLTFEGDRVLSHRIIEVGKRSIELTAVLEPRFSPNVTAAVSIPGQDELHAASDEAVVLQYLDVAVSTDKAEYKPGEEATVEVTAKDPSGKPVEAELSLAVIDASILRLEPDLVPPVKPFFYDQRRAHVVSTGSTQSFAYAGVTARKSADLVAEEERREEGKPGKPEAEAEKAGTVFGLARNRPAPTTAAPGAPPAAGAQAGGAGRMAKTQLRSAGRSSGGKEAKGKDGALADKGALPESKLALDELNESAAEDSRADGMSRKLTESLALGFGEGEGLERGAGPQPVEPTVRRRFADTALWKADVRTGKDGKAKVAFTVPDNLTGWRAAAVGSTRAAEEALVGDGETTFRTRKGILVRIQAPRFLTRDDRASLTTPVHNYLPEAARVAVEMVAKDLDAKSVTRTDLQIGAGDVASTDWDITPLPVAGGLLTARALSEKESDAIEEAIPIIPFGKRVRGGGGGLLEDEALVRFTLPELVVEGTGRLRVDVAPRVSDDLRRAVLWLRYYPYACVEQVVSGLVAALALNDALEKLGTPDEDLRNLVRDQVPKRVVRLLNAQRTSGGWSWWGPQDGSADTRQADHSDPRMTALALGGLEGARLAGFRVQEDRLEKARARAAALLKAQADPRAAALLARALSLSGKAPPEELNRLYRGRESASSSALALLGLALEAQGQRVPAADLARVLASRVTDLVSGGKVHGAYIRDRAGREGGADSVLATAEGLLLIDRIEPASAVAQRLAEGLLALRTGLAWLTTEASASAVIALASHAAREAATTAQAEVTVELNGEPVGSIKVGPARARDEKGAIEVPEGKLKKGENTLVLRKTGSGRFAYTAAWEAVEPAGRIDPEGNVLKVRRDYIAYVPPKPETPEAPAVEAPTADDGISSGDPAPRIAGAEAAWLLATEPPPAGSRILEASRRPAPKPRTVERTVPGEKVRVVITLEAREDLEYVLLEDPLPAGCEVIDDPERFEGSFDRREVRDQKVVFFRSRLPRGVHVLSYLLRPTFPGAYHALPAMASLMYEPAIWGRSADNRLRIERPEGRVPEPPPELTADEKLWEVERAFQALPPSGPATETLAALRERYAEILRLPLADPYADLVLARIAGIDLRAGPPDRAVKSFEEARRRNPRLLTAEEDVWRAAGAYGSAGERQPEVVLLRGLFERRYRFDREVSETFLALGQPLRAQAYGFEVLAYYPDGAPIIAEWFELARRYAALKAQEKDPRTGRPKERAMLRESVESLREFLAHFPASAQAPEAQLAVVTALESLGDWAGERREAEVFERRYPRSHLLDTALAKALDASFRLGKYAEVLERAPRLIEGDFPKPDGKQGKSEHAGGALYLVAKSYHALGRIAEAVKAYARVAQAVPDAQEALLYLTARELSAPPIASLPAVARPELEVSYRNVKKLSLRVYRVDLPVLFTVRKELRGASASAVNLTGIDPVKSWQVDLPGDESPRTAKVALPTDAVGAYLVVGRSEDRPEGPALAALGGSVPVLEFSSVVLRSDLEVDLQRVGERIRVHVFRTAGGKRETVPGATVRVSDGQAVRATGVSDARGVFEAAVGGGHSSVLAEKDGHFALKEE